MAGADHLFFFFSFFKKTKTKNPTHILSEMLVKKKTSPAFILLPFKTIFSRPITTATL